MTERVGETFKLNIFSLLTPRVRGDKHNGKILICRLSRAGGQQCSDDQDGVG